MVECSGVSIRSRRSWGERGPQIRPMTCEPSRRSQILTHKERARSDADGQIAGCRRRVGVITWFTDAFLVLHRHAFRVRRGPSQHGFAPDRVRLATHGSGAGAGVVPKPLLLNHT